MLSKIASRLIMYGVGVATALSAYLIIPFEGEVVNKGTGRYEVYIDAVGVPTACWGQTGKDHDGKPIRVGTSYTFDECVQMLAKTLKHHEDALKQMVKVDYKSPYQQAAIVSFTYNVGLYDGGFKTSTLLKLLNEGKHDLACDQLTRWVYAKKKKLPGLVNRRTIEYKWCMGEVPLSIENAYEELLPLLAQYEQENRGGIT